MKKLLNRSVLALGTVGVVIAGAAAFSAFEAHVINVTARIENALSVDTSFIEFGTVFPQEHLERGVKVGLSQSFLDEDRVDDVEYFIRQKPKCAITSEGGTVVDLTVGQNGSHAYTGTGHITLGDNPATPNDVETDFPLVDCGPAPRTLALDDTATQTVDESETWGVLPDLCPYISKDGSDEDGRSDENDDTTPSFHKPFTVVGNAIQWLDTAGKLIKSLGDTVDNWVIDLSVPCFDGYCAQDWADFVEGQNPGANPDEFTQPIANEHKVYGCDLWVEVSGVSTGLCNADVALVLDKSGSIGADLPTLQLAAHAFVDALNISTNGPHGAQVSFETTPTLDVPLTDDETLLHTAINNLVLGSNTDIAGGINTASTELANGRPAAPDFIVLITDGIQTVPGDPVAAATAAKAAGATIYVVGVGAGVDTNLLQNSIATSPAHYFAAADFDDLEAILENLADCPEDNE